ncbi:MAG: type II toxin-antitoxin system VapC family toxin, partial [Pseudomonadota bacterium]|nr:type II toxin-antitoxin system VapC family toxin [Pseudomonadota bacterium]
LIIVDTSVLIAIQQQEAEAESFLSVLARAPSSCIAAPTYFETLLVAFSKKVAGEREDLRCLVVDLGLSVVPWTSAMAETAATAFERLGRGRHKAALTSAIACPTPLPNRSTHPCFTRAAISR